MEIIAKSGQGYTANKRYIPSTGAWHYEVRKGGDSKVLFIVQDSYGYQGRITRIMLPDNTMVAYTLGDYVTRALTLCVDASEGRLNDDVILDFYDDWDVCQATV